MFDLYRFKKSFIYAYRGLTYLLVHEQNFRLHIIFAILALSLSLILSVNYYETLIILLLIFNVMMAEIVNTVIENILDIIHPDHHDQIRIIKDATAGIVLFAALIALVIGSIIFIPKILHFF